jgi:hypothetical protein
VTGRSAFAIGLAIAKAFAFPGPALAQTPVTYSLDYRPAENCPNEDGFVQAIQARAPGARRTEAGSAQVVFEAHVSAESGISRGFLLVRLAGGGVTRRDVPDASCNEIVTSMAVIAALVIEGSSASATESPAPPWPGATAPSESVPGASAPPAKTPTPAAKPGEAAKPAPAAPPFPVDTTRADALSSPRLPLRQTPATAVRAGLSVAVGFESATAHELTPALAVGIEISARAPDGWSPSARLSGLYSQSGRQERPDGTARFRWLAARLALCPFSFTRANSALRPCVELDAGELRGEGDDTTNAQTPSLLWLAGGAALHGELGLGPVLALEGQLGARVLAEPGRFVFLPNDTAHETGRVSLGALIGLVARLP